MTEGSGLVRHNSAEIATETFEDGVVSINFLTGRYFSFNPLGEKVWDAFADAADPDAVAAAIAAEAGDPGLAEGVRLFVEDLLRERLLARIGEAPPPPPAAAPPAARPAHWPQLLVYDDLADLILLDPIHDVSETMGWPVARR
ncbi:MAG: PqqD family peptide modification chaperone [Acetobacteraceae bacterium]|nr:PqqD family peptide modification chaperone [Acetobacteraceae bacterium]MDW8398423.1 PqqD family peptide modification chaperone [Acetobacteraceae bacterium]